MRQLHTFGMPMATVYHDLDKIETEHYILRKVSYRYPDHAIQIMRGGMIPGDYVILWSKDRGCVVMSDTPMERYTNRSLIANAHGDICILGLGIGMVIFYLIEEQSFRSIYDDLEPTLNSITIIEKDKELIDLIEPLIRNNVYFEESMISLNIVNADAYEYPKICNRRYDLVYADIWDDYIGYEEDAHIFDELESLYRPFCSKFDGWGYDDSHGNNPYDESPIERDEYAEWLRDMIVHYKSYYMISSEISQNISDYIHEMSELTA